MEDEEIIIGLLQKKLDKEGYEISVARDGEEGLNMIKEIWPDLILLDINMPKMEGFRVMEEINKNPTLQRIPIIVMFDSPDSVDLKRAQALGAKDWFVKTELNLQQILNKVVEQIGR